MTRHALAFACSLLAAAAAQAQFTAPSAPNPFAEEIRQQERERALRRQQESAVDERPRAPVATEQRRLPPAESPCFRIDRVRLAGEGAERFQWALDAAGGPGGDDTPIGRCLGTEGIDIVLARLQQALIARGWITTRALAAPQDLSGGTLAVTVVPGRIAAIRFADDASAAFWKPTLASAIPAAPGDLLNLRDIEQGLENLKRAPTAEADIRIEPSSAPDARPGDSDLVVAYAQKLPLRATLSLDDSGTRATGRNQAGATLAWDGPLGLNDLFYVSANHDAFNHKGSGTSGQTLHYSVPFGYWLLGATASQSRYHQTVRGADQSYVYSGESRNVEMRLSRLLYRDATRKTTVSLRGFRRASDNAIDDTAIEVQRRVVAGWEANLNHKEFVGAATLEGTLGYRRGTHAFGAIAAPEEAFGEGTSYLRLYTAEASANVPFALAGQTLRYSALWRAQWNRTPLTPLDRFSIGGRFTVRGFDGNYPLLGDRGWLLRQDLGWAVWQTGAEAYLGVDVGHVGGRSVPRGSPDHLAGAVVGIRGAFRGLNYDVSVGSPIRKPAGYRTSRTTGGFNLNFSF